MRCSACHTEFTEGTICPKCGHDQNATELTISELEVATGSTTDVEESPESGVTRLDSEILASEVAAVREAQISQEETLTDINVPILPMDDVSIPEAVEQPMPAQISLPAEPDSIDATLEMVDAHLQETADEASQPETVLSEKPFEQKLDDNFESLMQDFYEEPSSEALRDEVDEKPDRRGKFGKYLKSKWKLILAALLFLMALAIIVLVLAGKLTTTGFRGIAKYDDRSLMVKPASRLSMGQARLTGSLMDFSKNGLFVCAARDADVSLENVATGETYGPFTMQSKIIALALSADGEIVALGTEEAQLLVLNAKTGIALRELDGFLVAENGLKIHRIEPVLIAASQDGHVAVVGLADGNVLYKSDQHESVSGLAVFPQENLIALALPDGVINVINYNTEALVSEINTGRFVKGIEFSPSGKKLLVTDESSISLWMIKKASNQWVSSALMGSNCEFLSERSILCVASSQLSVYDSVMGKLVQSFTADQRPLVSFRYHREAETLVLMNNSSRVMVYSMQESTARDLNAPEVVQFSIEPITVSNQSLEEVNLNANEEENEGDIVIALNPIDQAELVKVPEEQYLVKDMTVSGTGPQDLRYAYLTDYYIYRYEVTNHQYQQCIENGVCSEPVLTTAGISKLGELPLYGQDKPVVGVTWFQALSYCTWAGGELPSESQWDAAARFGNKNYPWGENKIDATRANYNQKDCTDNDQSMDGVLSFLTPVGSYPLGESWCGAQDMSGNVAEWTGNRDTGAIFSTSRQALVQSNKISIIVRGGSWCSNDKEVSVNYRLSVSPYSASNEIGFRCIIDRLP